MSPDTAVAQMPALYPPSQQAARGRSAFQRGFPAVTQRAKGKQPSAVRAKRGPPSSTSWSSSDQDPSTSVSFDIFHAGNGAALSCHHSFVLASATSTHRPATVLANVPASCSTSWPPVLWALLLVFPFLPGETEKQCFTDRLIFCKCRPANTRSAYARGALSGMVAPRGRPCAKQSRTHVCSAQGRSAFG